MDKIGAIYYINLAHRTDRKKQFEQEMANIGFPQEKIHRIDAISKPSMGALGCGLSHIKALDTFLASEHSYCLIFEDDFMFSLNLDYCKFLLKYAFTHRPDFDLLMLSGNIMKSEPTDLFFLQRVLDGQTVSGILVPRHFAKCLRDTFQEAVLQLEEWYMKTNERKHEYCIDIYWKRLQPVSKWYIFSPKLGIQRESYSDNEEKITNYGV